MAEIWGNNDDNTLNGTAGTDSIYGQGGNDLIYGKGGNDRIEGGDGIDWLYGGGGGDSLYGGNGNDFLIGNDGDINTSSNGGYFNGGAGDDYLQGDFGSDHYVFDLGGGVDTIDDALYSPYSNSLSFGNGINPADISVVLNGSTLEFHLTNSTDKVRVLNWGCDESGNFTINQIHFQYPIPQWSGAYVHQLVIYSLATEGADNIQGIPNYDTVLNGLGGDDHLSGSSGNDTISGGDGNDYIAGDSGQGNGKDIMAGGTGNDTLLGGLGSDTYLFDLGDGVDTIREENPELSTDVLRFGAGIDRADIRIVQNGQNLEFQHENGIDKVIVADGALQYNNGHYNLDRFEFAADDSTFALNASLFGFLYNDILNGTTGSDIIIGNAGNDTLSAGDGDDWLDGGEGNDQLYGGAGDDQMVGGADNDTLTGGTGNDTLSGGVGSDTYLFNLGDGVDTINETEGASYTDVLRFGPGIVRADINIVQNGQDLEFQHKNGTDKVVVANWFADSNGNHRLDQVEFTDDSPFTFNPSQIGTDGDNFLYGTASSDLLMGNGGNDVLSGEGGDDWLVGGEGADTMDGGSGNDTYVVDNAGDEVRESINGGLEDTIQSSISWTLAPTPNVENLTLTGSADIDGTGNTSGTVGNVLTGNSGNNVLNGLAGADTMAGGLGNDTYVVDNVLDVVVENFNEGIDSVQSSVTYTLTDNVENLVLTGTGAISGTGNALDNIITGNSGVNVLDGGQGKDRLDGGAGADELKGGTGDDTYIVGAGDTVKENETENEGVYGGEDKVEAGLNWTLHAYVENLELTGTGNFSGTGNGDNNVIKGNSGNNILNGGKGVDTVSGGAGNDSYWVDQTNDMVVELAGEGTDLVRATTSWTMSDHIENLTLTGNLNLNGTGNDLANVITGNNGNNILYGGDGNDTLNGNIGADTLYGEAGDDTYVVDNALDVVNEADGQGVDTIQSAITWNLTLANAYVENLTLTGTTDIEGSGNERGNILVGNSGNNTLNGFAGNDTLDGGAGADTLKGGSGNDLYFVDNALDSVEEGLEDGLDTVHTSIAWTLLDNIENLVLTGEDAIGGTGNTLNNTLTGNSANNLLQGDAGADTLDGGAGADTLDGGTGDDIYILGVGDEVREGSNAGMDTVRSDITCTLAANVENLVLTGTANIDGTGNSIGNDIIGNDGNNLLNGGLGVDTMQGGMGDDIYMVNHTSDSVIELAGAGYDFVRSYASWEMSDNIEKLRLMGTGNINGTGSNDNNEIIGNSGRNNLSGGAGNDTLVGGLGNDTLTGGSDSDVFVFDSVLDATTNVDKIEIYNADQDSIRLENTGAGLFEALLTTGPLEAAAFQAGAGLTAATETDDRIIYDTSTGALYYDADGVGGSDAIQFAVLDLHPPITSMEFFVV